MLQWLPLHFPESGNLSMKWSCGHEGHLNLDWLKRHCHSAKTLEEARESSAPIPLTQVLL